MFASKNVGVHLLRGMSGFICLALSFQVERLAVRALFFIAAIVLWRGCPMCWTVGLVQTLLGFSGNKCDCSSQIACAPRT